MHARQTWVLAVAVVLAALILGVAFGSRTVAQPAKAEPAAAERYQVVRGWQEKDGTFLLIDTATGHCWTNYLTGNRTSWTDLGSPAQAQK